MTLTGLEGMLLDVLAAMSTSSATPQHKWQQLHKRPRLLLIGARESGTLVKLDIM